MENIIDVERINRLLNQLLLVNREFKIPYSSQEYAKLIQEAEEYKKILTTQLAYEHGEAIKKTRQIFIALNALRELRKDKDDLMDIFSDISKEYDEKVARESFIATTNKNLKDMSSLLNKVKEDKLDEFREMITGKISPINKMSSELVGKDFGELYQFISSKKEAGRVISDLDKIKKSKEAEKEVEEQNGK